jgi:virulence factor
MGLQKRFGTINSLLTSKVKHVKHYYGKYLTGSYPEGNPVFELFIHPIDCYLQLFGKASVQFLKNGSSGSSQEYLLILAHGNATGIVELSTGYNWNTAVDSLLINTNKEVLTVRYPNFVQGEEKCMTFVGVPLEKIGKSHPEARTYLNNDGVIPSMENGNLYVQGFYGAISHFVRAVETNTADLSFQPESLVNVFEILDQLSGSGTKKSHV